MGRTIDYEAAQTILVETFVAAQIDFQNGNPVDVPATIADATTLLMASKTQAFREALIGCALARILDQEIDLRLPYMSQGDNAFNGRTLDEKVVNPFLQEKEVPCSKAPYLSVLRRNISFVPETAKGVRDKNAFQAMLEYINELGTADAETAGTYLRNLLFSFLVLRGESRITLAQINRLSLEQYGVLLHSLLGAQSGGLLPVLVGVATFESIRETYGLPWKIDWQGINVADSASGAGGDITVSRDGRPIITIEVTERPIDRARVRATFNAKISPNRLDDYIFFYSGSEPSDDAREAARTYFAQGHDVNFLPLKDWTMTVMSALGQAGRRVFVNRMVALLEQETPAGIKVVWNDAIRAIVS